MYILFGLHITSGIDSFTQSVLTWIIYTVMCSTFINVFLLGYFWAVVHKKTGPTGLRGPIGERGSIGLEGKCELDLVEVYLIKELIQHIDDLYFAKTNYHILNTDTYTVPCTYLNNKIAVMSASRQYKTIYKNLYISYNSKLYDTPNFNTDTQQTDTKPISSIVYYLKNIWKEWFNLIYDATTIPGDWFNDQYADEEYSWVGSDPFLEIRKYDVYYWGITRNFRPLKAEICRNNPNNSKLPIINQILEPKLKIIETNDYYKVGDTKNSMNNKDASFWTPNPVTINSDTYYPVGDLFILGKNDPIKKGKTIVDKLEYTNDTNTNDTNNDVISNGPDMRTILVTGDIADPINYKQVEDIHSRNGVIAYTPVCPDGYTSLGDVSKGGDCLDFGDNRTVNTQCSNFNNFKCIPTECVEEVSPGVMPKEVRQPNQWNRYNKWYNGLSARWSWTWYGNVNTLNNSLNGGSLNADPKTGYNLFRAPQGQKASAPFYKIKDTCLVPAPDTKKPIPKSVESKYDDLGIGWYGHPYKLEPKYSIFSFLGLAPEGMIVHSGTGRRYYAIHYGGEEPSIYIVLHEDGDRNYTNAIQVNSNSNDSNTDLRSISKLDTRQQWRFILESDKKYFKLLSIYNNKNLNIDLDPRLGNAIYSTKLKNNNETNADPVNYLFSFIPSFGTHLNNLSEK